MLTVRELYDFLHEKGVEDNNIDIIYRDGDNTRWVGYNHDKEEALKIHGDREVFGVDIFEKD